MCTGYSASVTRCESKALIMENECVDYCFESLEAEGFQR